MNRSVMVIDTPNNCKECIIGKCKHWLDDDVRPKECPLKPLPPPEPCNFYNFNTFTSGVAHGFNRFYEQITGETT